MVAAYHGFIGALLLSCEHLPEIYAARSCGAPGKDPLKLSALEKLKDVAGFAASHDGSLGRSFQGSGPQCFGSPQPECAA